MPLLTRMVGTPLTIDIGPGAVAGLAPLLADRRISSGGHVAIAVGPGQGEEIAEVLRPQLANAEIWMVEGGTVEAATELRGRLRSGFFDAVVGIGGGKTLDIAKYAAAPLRAADGRGRHLARRTTASPRRSSSLEEGGPQGQLRRADADRGRGRPRLRARERPGDAALRDRRRGLQPRRDRRLVAGRARARASRSTALAVTFARTAATSVLHREDGIDDDDFLIALAEALVLSGLAMVDRGLLAPVLGRRPRDPPRDRPPLPGHRAPRRAGRRRQPVHVLAAGRRQDGARHRRLPDAPWAPPHPRRPRARRSSSSPARSSHAPATRPDRYTILEHLDLSRGGGGATASARTQRPTVAELRAVAQPARDLRAQLAASTGRASSTSGAARSI